MGKYRPRTMTFNLSVRKIFAAVQTRKLDIMLTFVYFSDLVTFTEEILNGILHFLYSASFGQDTLQNTQANVF